MQPVLVSRLILNIKRAAYERSANASHYSVGSFSAQPPHHQSKMEFLFGDFSGLADFNDDAASEVCDSRMSVAMGQSGVFTDNAT